MFPCLGVCVNVDQGGVESNTPRLQWSAFVSYLCVVTLHNSITVIGVILFSSEASCARGRALFWVSVCMVVGRGKLHSVGISSGMFLLNSSFLF